MSNPNWGYDSGSTALSTNKVDLNPLGTNPANEYQVAAEQNLGNQALDDLRRIFEPLFSFQDQPAAGAKMVVPVVRPITLDTNFGAGGTAASRAFVGTNPTADATFPITSKGVSGNIAIGSLIIHTTGALVWTLVGTQSLVPGDFLIVTAPTPQDATLADVFIRLCAKK